MPQLVEISFPVYTLSMSIDCEIHLVERPGKPNIGEKYIGRRTHTAGDPPISIQDVVERMHYYIFEEPDNDNGGIIYRIPEADVMDERCNLTYENITSNNQFSFVSRVRKNGRWYRDFTSGAGPARLTVRHRANSA